MVVYKVWMKLVPCVLCNFFILRQVRIEWRLFYSRPGTLPEDGVINPTKTSGDTSSFQNFCRGKVPTHFYQQLRGCKHKN